MVRSSLETVISPEEEAFLREIQKRQEADAERAEAIFIEPSEIPWDAAFRISIP